MINVLQYTPGQKVTLFLAEKDMTSPVVSRVILPDGTYAPEYPQSMTYLADDVARFEMQLPTGAAAVGSYLVTLSYYTSSVDDETYQSHDVYYQIVVTAPFGQYGATSF